ncbi:MAG: hypothetical protein IT424_14350 [Pirellulales bacterium]|nr:hypothetical protein [Pirellulales bacterium]
MQVAGDDELAAGLRLLRGEWKARSGGELDVRAGSLDDLAAGLAGADLVIFPSRWLGHLVERGDLRPMRRSVLDSAELGFNDLFPALRSGELRYAGQIYALSLGSPPLMACYDGAAEQSPGNEPPQPAARTWDEFDSIKTGAEAPRPAALPLADRAAAISLLGRALGYIEPHRRSEALFDPASMAPGITQPPFVRALTEMVAATEPPPEIPLDFAAALGRVHTGQSAAALGWPTIVKTSAAIAAATRPLHWAPLPVGRQIYQQLQATWENQSTPARVTLLGAEGRLVGVTTATRNAVAAFELAQWLTAGDPAVQLSSRSGGTLWFRASQVPLAGKWLGPPGPAAPADQAATIAAVDQALATDSPVLIPRLPSIDEYLNALAQAVRSAEPGEASARTALEAASAAWESITDRLGRDKQLRAYHRHLNIDEGGPD